eukprot:756272-Hanusia_phi.AAC.8
MTRTDFVTEGKQHYEGISHPQPVQEITRPAVAEQKLLHSKLLHLIQIQHKILQEHNLVTDDLKRTISDVKLECQDCTWVGELPDV